MISNSSNGSLSLVESSSRRAWLYVNCFFLYPFGRRLLYQRIDTLLQGVGCSGVKSPKSASESVCVRPHLTQLGFPFTARALRTTGPCSKHPQIPLEAFSWRDICRAICSPGALDILRTKRPAALHPSPQGVRGTKHMHSSIWPSLKCTPDGIYGRIQPRIGVRHRP